MKIKVCGLTSVDQIRQLADLKIDYAGMIFYDRSPRFFIGKMASKELQPLSKKVKLTGVFVNEKTSEIRHRISEYHLSAVQLCGNESPAECRELMNDAEVFKVIPLGSNEKDIEFFKHYEDACDYFLFDTKSKHHGGSGKKFDWDILREKAITKPFLLSGGISVEDATAINNFQHSHFTGIDINSRFEISPGIKDVQKIKSFIDKLKRS